jgi:hypothetical protein
MTHLYPSRYCQADKLVRFAHTTFGNLATGYHRVNGICNWIRENVEYKFGISDALTSAFDTVTERAGVCRDSAHLAIALCRAMGIPLEASDNLFDFHMTRISLENRVRARSYGLRASIEPELSRRQQDSANLISGGNQR